MPHPFVVFLIILVVIWALSGIASVINKQKEQERRARMRAQLERAAAARGVGQMTSPPLPPAARQTISEGIAERFPDVLLPPQPAPPRRQAPMPPPAPITFDQSQPPRPAVRRPPPPPVAPQRAGKRPPVPARPPAVPVLEEDNDTPRGVLASSPPPTAPSTAPAPAGSRKPTQAVDAASLSRWLKPATLRHQFMLTEVLQPPLALREERQV